MAIGWLRDFFNPASFYAAQSPILRITFITGMTPFTVMKVGRKDVLRCTAFGYLNSIIQTVLICICFAISLINQESITGYFFKSGISVLGNYLQFFTGLTALVMTFFYSVFRRNRLIRAFHSLAKTDEHFKEIGVETDYRSTLLYNCFIMIYQFFVQIIYIGVSVAILFASNVYPRYTAWVAFFIPYLMMAMIIVLFVCLVNQTKHRFYLLNKVLRSLEEISLEKKLPAYDETQNCAKVIRLQKPLRISSTFWNTNRYMPEVINRVASIQDELCDACNSVQEYFKVQMLTIVAITFLIVVFNTYYILEIVFTKNMFNTPCSKFQFFAFFFCQAVIHAFGVLKLIVVSSLAVQENDKIAVNVHKLINVNNYDDDVVKQLSNLSLQLTHRKVSFTAYGLFNLDFTLLFTLTGAATTYLVILVQFTINQNELCGPKLINSTIASLAKNASLFQND
ncbi:putative gustatory receptor 28b isoform X2 [Wyeomyia smithii]|uniref:putative gustatory receptor 28b isoform X2 n=1 Tax=Wyeomyia smithii TaxID=174621 RepID=UPI0024681572|nr:putative gustatory receptor 28b isoform X2 [Wyeomyia smithii]